MKVIFLDIDGVLASGNHLWSTHALRHKQSEITKIPYNSKNTGLCKTRDEFGNLFDPTCVLNLARIILATNAKIVISSSWRYPGTEYMREIWKFRKLPGEVIDVTPTALTSKRNNTCRGDEINEWLFNHPEVESYVIIDDDTDMTIEQIEDHYVGCENEHGLTYHKANQAIHILNKD